jgi:hypothetical protein
VFVPGKPFQLFAGKAGAYLGVEHLKGASIRQALDLPANIRLDWKGFPRTNTLDDNGNPQITAVKSFMV